MKTAILTILGCFLFISIYSQSVKIYNPDADVNLEVSKALVRAKAENKHIFLQVGGNWCSWCIKFHKLYDEDAEVKALMSKNFIPILVNYSKENRNNAFLKTLEYPQRFGFPVIVILDKNGKRLHTQNSSYLEEGDGYSTKKVLDLLSQWSPDALNPEHYKEK